MDRLFSLPWYKIGMHRNQVAEEQDAILSEKEAAMEHDGGIVHQVEVVERVEILKAV